MFGSRNPRRVRRASFSPRLMPLETRALLATFTVSSPLDSGPGTLRQAVLDAEAAAGADTIDFDLPTGTTIALTSGPLFVSENLAVDGPGAGKLTVSGSDQTSIFVMFPRGFTPADTIDVSIAGLTLADGRGAFGAGAIEAQQTRLAISDSAFVGNHAPSFGGAIVVFATFDFSTFPATIIPGSLTIVNSEFVGNTSENGGAIAIFDTPTTVVRSSFTGNEAGFGGGAIFNQRSTDSTVVMSVLGSRFDRNVARNPGSFALGGAIFNRGEAVVADSSFAGNQALGRDVGQGGAIHNDFFARLTVAGSHFDGNLARADSPFAGGGAAGGALSGDLGSGMTVRDSRFRDNRAESAGFQAVGGAIKNSGGGFSGPIGALVIINSTFERNAAVGLDAAAGSFQAASAFGGAVYNEGGPLSINRSTFRDNVAAGGSGGATGLGGFGAGGGVSSRGTSLTLTNSTFEGNVARSGDGANPFEILAVGGGLEHAFSGGAPSSITDTKFVGNQAIGGAGLGAASMAGSAWGGGLALPFNGSPVTLTNVQVVNNAAIGGSGATAGGGQGGGLYVSGTTATIVGGQFSANRAVGGDSTAGGAAGAGRGGGIYGNSFGGLALQGTKLNGNRAIGGVGATGGDAEGGGLWAAGVVTLLDANIHGNRADAGPAGQGFGGGVFLAPGTISTINKKTKINGNHATTAGDNLYQA
jgi:hypothetical protein